MHIHLIAADSSFERSLSHIVPLFYEEPKVTFSSSEDAEADLEIRLTVEDGPGEVRAEAALRVKANAAVPAGSADEEAESAVPRRIAKHRQAYPADAAHEERRRLVKLTLSRALVDALQQETGIVQPWGILTGVRPTKLLHDSLRRGRGREEARRALREDYLVAEEKIALMERIVDRQLTALPDLYDLRNEVSVYIGIPFCPTKCAYCTFPAYDINGRQGSVGGFLYGLHHEVRVIGRWLKDNGVKVTTIYYGGGTPTSITAEEMDALYAEMAASFPDASQVREVTVEAGRPDTITPEKLAVLRKWNIDRISINPQSYIQETLDLIGRHHTVQETIDKFRLSRSEGMNNINMDLIIGLPGEGPAEFAHTLAETEKLLPESLTVHTLSFKRASEMTQHRGEAKYKVATREEIGTMMAEAVAWTDAHGYAPYYLYRQKNILGNLENVGYSFAGQESLYNILIIEEMQTIVGLGCGATSKWVDASTGAITRLANPKEPKAYIDTYEKYTEAKLEALERWKASRTTS
ncbi:coproporphyrinogen III oxidase [Cohnella nanjingensis]|uniref:Coproporphyrinogen III oxidase n=1 Tax=Cohnella nanjingensis TaxID=1387779 RepID=A0A7X0VHM1_9BACL|nr:coproporphyrinogen III oxidase [Cohnella nanjingensis]MBB6674290.1 coproporphyrinogen III oxidase [Cohnella nanjingensis]